MDKVQTYISIMGYVNFGNFNRDLNKRLIEDIETIAK